MNINLKKIIYIIIFILKRLASLFNHINMKIFSKLPFIENDFLYKALEFQKIKKVKS